MTAREDIKKYSGPGYFDAGGILIVQKEIDDEELKALIEWKNPSCVMYLKGCGGVMRIPQIKVLYGQPHEIKLRENGTIYCYDPSKVMFSMGNRNEKARMADMTKKDEKIADMFSGIGYFTIPCARAGGMIHAMEINPDSYGYLVRNAELNHVSCRVHAECGDCRDLLKGVYDRVLMGHFDSADMLGDILPHMKTGGILHIHSINEITDRIISAVRDAGFDADNTMINIHKVKKYAPHKLHIVSDVILG